jgi:hypothetical protein
MKHAMMAHRDDGGRESAIANDGAASGASQPHYRKLHAVWQSRPSCGSDRRRTVYVPHAFQSFPILPVFGLSISGSQDSVHSLEMIINGY